MDEKGIPFFYFGIAFPLPGKEFVLGGSVPEIPLVSSV
jgi:hypothetical protein